MVYVRCEGCDKDYIGESEQSLSTRITENKISKLKVNGKPAMCKHHLEIQHTIYIQCYQHSAYKVSPQSDWGNPHRLKDEKSS